jgi:hypothetical protein
MLLPSSELPIKKYTIKILKPILTLLACISIVLLLYHHYKNVIFNPHKSEPTHYTQTIKQLHAGLSTSQQHTTQDISVIQNRPPISQLPAISIGAILTPDTLSILSTRENQDLKAISDLQIETKIQSQIIDTQSKYIITLHHQVIKWKIISGILSAIIIKLVIFG